MKIQDKLRDLVTKSLLAEVTLTPKPGLVDEISNGAHHDMDFELFLRSTSAIAGPIVACFDVGVATAINPPTQTLNAIRSVGQVAEQQMFAATKGVNTHKGAIFSLGLICAAIGRLSTHADVISASAVCEEIAMMCAGLVKRELASQKNPVTAGERLYHRYGLTGARGEAESGFRLVREIALPIFLCDYHRNETFALHHTLLALMAVNPDTNIVSRSGLDALHETQAYAQKLLHHTAFLSRDLHEMALLLKAFDDFMIERHLSPGGSADLLIVTYFFANLDKITVANEVQIG